MATPRRQNPLDFQDARTPMNGETRTDLIQLITRTESLSSDDDLASPTEVDFVATGRLLRSDPPIASTFSRSLKAINDHGGFATRRLPFSMAH